MTDLSSQLEAAAAATGVTGAALAVWDGAQQHTAVTGLRNSITGDPLTIDTLLQVGSITKIFNATLVMQLVDDGLIALDDPVVKHLPDLRLGDMDALPRVTCRMLLNHTSGIDGEMLPDHGPDQERIEDFIARCARLGQLHEPGGGPSYCNGGTIIAGFLAQRLRGASWYTLVKERIFRPLELQHALVDLAELPLFRVSIGDALNRATGQLAQVSQPFLPLSFAPAGSTMMISAPDLITFARAHLNGGVGVNGVRILSEASARLMQQPTVQSLDPGGARFGLGWGVGPGGVLAHGGGMPGVATMLYLHPPSGRAAALLTNSDNGPKLVAALLAPLLQGWTGIAPKAVSEGDSVELHDLDPYLGRFGNSATLLEFVDLGGRLGVRMSERKSHLEASAARAGPVLPLRAMAGRVFVSNDGAPTAVAARFLDPDASGRCPAVAGMNRLFRRMP